MHTVTNSLNRLQTVKSISIAYHRSGSLLIIPPTVCVPIVVRVAATASPCNHDLIPENQTLA